MAPRATTTWWVYSRTVPSPIPNNCATLITADPKPASVPKCFQTTISCTIVEICGNLPQLWNIGCSSTRLRILMKDSGFIWKKWRNLSTGRHTIISSQNTLHFATLNSPPVSRKYLLASIFHNRTSFPLRLPSQSTLTSSHSLLKRLESDSESERLMLQLTVPIRNQKDLRYNLPSQSNHLPPLPLPYP